MERIEIIYSEKYKRTNIRFNEKPSEEVRTELKNEGWYYSKNLNIWYPTGKAADNSKQFAEYIKDKYFVENQKTVVTDNENIDSTVTELPVNNTVLFEDLIKDLQAELKKQNERIAHLEAELDNVKSSSNTHVTSSKEPNTSSNTNNEEVDIKTDISPEESSEPSIKLDEIPNKPYYFYIRKTSEFDDGNIGKTLDQIPKYYDAKYAVENLLILNEEARKNNTSLWGIGITIPGTLDHGEDFTGHGVVEFFSKEKMIYEIDDIFFNTSSTIKDDKRYINALNELKEAGFNNHLAIKLPKQLLSMQIANDLLDEMVKHQLGIDNDEDESYSEDEEELSEDEVINGQLEDMYDDTIPEEFRHGETIEKEEETSELSSNNDDNNQKEQYSTNFVNPYPEFKNHIDMDVLYNDEKIRKAFQFSLYDQSKHYLEKFFPGSTLEEIRILTPNDKGFNSTNNSLQVFISFKSDDFSEEMLRTNINKDLQIFADFNTEWTPVEANLHGSIDDYIDSITSSTEQQTNNDQEQEDYLKAAIINALEDEIKNSQDMEDELEEEDDMKATRGTVTLEMLNNSKASLQSMYNRSIINDVEEYVGEQFPDVNIYETKIFVPSEFNMEGDKDVLHVMVSFDSEEVKDDTLFNALNEDLQIFPHFKVDWFPIDINEYGSIDEYLEMKKEENAKYYSSNEHKTNKEIVDIRNEAKRIIEKPDNEITPADLEILKQYEGAGGLKEDNRTNSGILNEFYTPDNLVEKVWKIVDHYAPNGKTVLEPSSGVGRFANGRPNNEFTMFELDETSSRINHLLHPEATIINKPFQAQFFDEGERAKLPDYEQPKFDIVIGNPPYGNYNSEWKGKGEGKEFDRYEEYFIDRGLLALRNSNSVLAFVVPSGFLKTADDKAKRLIADEGILIDAYRLPENTFPSTSVGTDIIIMKPNDYSISFDDRLNLISNNNWFKEHPEKILGEIKTKTNRFGKEEEYVTTHEGKSIQDELNAIESFLLPTEIESKEEDLVPEEISNETIDSNEEIKASAEIDGVPIEATIKADTHPSNENTNDNQENDEPIEEIEVELTDEDIDLASLVIPKEQFNLTVDYALEGEDSEFYKATLKKTADTYRKIHTNNEIINEDGTHPIGFRYFYGESEFYISEIDTDGVGFGYAILNGDLEMSEFGSISIEELLSIDGMEMDYYVPEGMSIEQKLYKEHPDYKFWFPNPAEKDIYEEITDKSDEVKVEPETKKEKKKETSKAKKISKKEQNLEKSKGELLDLNQFCELYGKEYNEHDYNIWRSTDWEGNITLTNLSLDDVKYLRESGDYIEQETGSWTSKVLFASGDIVQKIQRQTSLLETSTTETERERYTKNIDILKSCMNEPIKFENMHIGLLTTLAQDFTIEHENDLGVTEYLNLRESFILWAKGETLDNQSWRTNINFSIANISREDFPADISWSDVVDYIDKVSVKAEKINRYTKWGKTDEEIKEIKNKRKTEAELKRMARAETADKLFDRYIHEGLPEEEQKKLLEVYNERFNSYVTPDYSKLPLYISGMSSHKGEKEFKLYEQQIKGISFLCNKGNGLLAYDVGVGKTAAGIVATVNQIQTGRSHRPLIVVPNSVYSKWYTDIRQLFPDVKINDLYNLNAESAEDYIDPDEPHRLIIPDGSISLVTYEALKNITFTDKSIENELYDDFSKLLSADFNGSEMQNAATSEKIKQAIGVASQVDNTQYFLYEDSGFDNITVDEAHNFKNLWTVPRPETKGESNEFSGIPTGNPSNRALKLYAMTQLTQRHNENRNVFLLTATPFTNSPLEVYSMLSYMGRQRLIDSGIYSLRDFLNEFAKTKIELGVTPKGDIGTKQVMKSWKSLPALQKLLTEFIDKVTAEQAGIERPRKYLENGKNPHVIKLDMSNLQKEIIKQEEIRMTMASSGSGDVLKAMNNMRMAMVAPALLNPLDYVDTGIVLPSTKDLVETSPKLKFVCSLVSDMYKEHPDKGQYIYMPLGKDAHKLVKEYLINQGIPKDAIEIINGDTNNTVDKKDKISKKFNDKTNKLKILIGGQNTSEGIDLNGNSFAMYNLSLGWNPSETVQAEGRIWRQGNNQQIVHCIYPVMNDSIDALLYQKHDEKISRINDLWSYKGNDLNVESINPEELKFELIKDPKKRVRLILDEETKELRTERTKIELKQQSFSELITARENIKETLEELNQSLEGTQKWRQEYIDKGQDVPEWLELNLKNDEKQIKKYTNQSETVEEKFKNMGLKTDEDIEKHGMDLANEKVRIDKEIQNVEKKLPSLLRDMELKLKRQKLTAYSIEKQKDIVKNVILKNIISKDEEDAKKKQQEEIKKQQAQEVESAQTESKNDEKVEQSEKRDNVPLEDEKQHDEQKENSNVAEDGQQQFIFDSAVIDGFEYGNKVDLSGRLPRDYKANEISFFTFLNSYMKNGMQDRDQTFGTRTIPKIFNFAGIEASNISVDSEVLKRAKNISDFSNNEILDSLASSSNPIVLKEGVNENGEPNYIAYTNTFKDGKPIVLTFNKDKDSKGLKLSNIETLNDKHFMNDESKILYFNDNQIDKWQGEVKDKIPHFEIDLGKDNSKKYNEYDEKYNHPLALINAKNDDKSLTEPQKKDIEYTRNEIVDPILNGTQNGLWAAYRDFKEYGVFDIKGSKVELEDGHLSFHGRFQLNTAMEIYRNKKFESFRYLFIDKKSGEIFDQLAVSAHLPSSCPISVMKGNLEVNLEEVIERAKEKDCHIAVAHNHPSGNPEPSDEDKIVTKELQDIFDERVGENAFLGHIILDHDRFSYYTKEDGWQSYIGEHTVDRFHKEGTPLWFNTQISNKYALFDVAKEVNDINNWNDNFTPVVFANAALRITAIKLYKTDFFMNRNYESIHNKLQMDAFNLAGSSAFPIVTYDAWNKLSPSGQVSLERQLKNCIEKNCFTDAAIPGASIISKHHINSGKFYEDPISIKNIEVKSTWQKQIDPKLFKPANRNVHKKEVEMER